MHTTPHSEITKRKISVTKRKHYLSRNPRGRRKFGNKGNYYWSVLKNGRRYAEHRLIMQRILRRKLQPDERVLHKNGNRLDNRPENLEVFLARELGNMFSTLGDKWARNFNQCIACHTRHYRHWSRGLCRSCYVKHWKQEHALYE